MLNKSEFEGRLQLFKKPFELTVKDFATTVGYLDEKLMAPLHRLNVPLAILIGGATNVGKTAIIKHLFIDEMGRQRFGKFFEENVKSKKQPDITRHISRLPYGTKDPSHSGIVIYDMPGLGADENFVDRIARAALGMELTPWEEEEWEEDIKDEKGIEVIEVIGVREAEVTVVIDGKEQKRKRNRIKRRKELREVEFHLYSLPKALHSPAKYEVKWVPVADVPRIIHDRPLTCLYIVNSASDTLGELQTHVTWLKEKFDKVVFAKTFRDQMETEEWDDSRKNRRIADLDDILGEDAVWINGRSGEGADGVARRLLELNEYVGVMAEHLGFEVRCRQLFSACQQIPGVIIPAFFSQALEKDAHISVAIKKDVDTELSDILSFLTYFLIHIVYTEDPENDPQIETFHENVQQFTAELKDTAVEKKRVSVRRNLWGFWEKLGNLFGGPDYKTTFYNVNQLARTPASLGQLYYWVYTLIHEREAQESESVIVPKKVPEEKGLEWFVNQFQPYEDLLRSDADDAAWNFYQAIGTDTLTNFFQIHHPEVMPVHKPTHLAKDEAEESTE